MRSNYERTIIATNHNRCTPSISICENARASCKFSERGVDVAGVSGFAVGRLVGTGRDALAITAPDANRVNVLEAATPDAPALPISAFTPTVGPNLVIALDIGGAGNTALDDLFVGSIG